MNAFARNEEHLYPVRESRVDQSQCLLPVLFSDPRSFSSDGKRLNEFAEWHVAWLAE